MKDEHELGKEIAGLLDESVEKTLKQGTLYRLQAARRAALENYQSDHAEIINSGDGTSVYGGHNEHFNVKKLLVLLMLLLILAGIVYWKFWDHDKYTAIDIMILSDDLPIDAYTDDEFEEWLNID